MWKDIELSPKADGKKVKLITIQEAAKISERTTQHVRAAAVSDAIDGGTILANPKLKNKGVAVIVYNDKFKEWCLSSSSKSKPKAKSMKELTKNFNEFMEGKEENPTGKDDFDGLLGDVLGD